MDFGALEFRLRVLWYRAQASSSRTLHFLVQTIMTLDPGVPLSYNNGVCYCIKLFCRTPMTIGEEIMSWATRHVDRRRILSRRVQPVNRG